MRSVPGCDEAVSSPQAVRPSSVCTWTALAAPPPAPSFGYHEVAVASARAAIERNVISRPRVT